MVNFTVNINNNIRKDILHILPLSYFQILLTRKEGSRSPRAMSGETESFFKRLRSMIFFFFFFKMLDDISLSIQSSSFAFSISLHSLFSPAGMPCLKKSKSNKIWPANSSHSEVPPEPRPAPQPGIQYVESHRFYEDPRGNSTSQQHVSIHPGSELSELSS
jgi:hypothetical protein